MSEKKYPTATEMDYPAHERNYSGFLKLVKWGIIVTVPIVALVVIIIGT